jgi:hypothetical protein
VSKQLAALPPTERSGERPAQGSGGYAAWAEQIRQLHASLVELEPAARSLGVASPEREEWYELLRYKLVPQVLAPAALVVAVTGGTNIGKSVVFNQLAGENASGVSPLAAGTKHPVCLVPPQWQSEPQLASLFAGFELRPWTSPENPLTPCDEHLLFWRASSTVPPRLLLLDTPDIDSDVEVNWQRADVVRQVADVLIAVLTQQKYNDASVKRFFRKAAEADKPVIIVFNQCDLVEDRAYWPEWLKTFVDETGVKAESVYVLPYDRAAAAQLKLPFYSVGRDGQQPPQGPADLRAELTSLHFDAIKIRTLRGALSGVLEPNTGAWSYLGRVRDASGGFAEAARSLGATEMARIRWPTLPTALLMEEIRQWWDVNRSPWSRNVNKFYRTVGQGIAWPVRRLREAWQGPASDPLDVFHRQEREAILEGIQSLFAQLARLAQVGNETLRPRLAALVAGGQRERLLAEIDEAHAKLPDMDEDYRAYVRAELDRWGALNPRKMAVGRAFDQVLAVARPAITVTLAVSGGIVAGDLAMHVIGHTASQFAADAAITAGATEAAVAAGGEGFKQSAAILFRRLQDRYAELRAQWLAAWVEQELLGDLLAELRRGAALADSPHLRDADTALRVLARLREKG